MNSKKLIQLSCLSALSAALFCSANLNAQTTADVKPSTVAITPEAQAVLDRISDVSMRSNLTFLASDLLEGRGTPSRGLDIAAEYIAAQFSSVGLEPAGDQGYFQTADWDELAQKLPVRPGRPAPVPKPAGVPHDMVRNVVGVLRGSDPALKDTYILVTAHYDHLGINTSGVGDRFFNGANDDGSGTVSVIELAKAFSALKVHPKRSIVFMTFFGEEKGLVGSRYYGAHPIFPIAKTIAGINIEQVGRTDDSEGPQVASVGITGFDFSEVGAIIKQSGDATGIRVWKHPINSDRYFAYSDNQALADQGIPAHTISVAYEFPDYHKVSDKSDKVDYANMAKVDRSVALAVYTIANSASEPKWNADNAKAAKYLKAWADQHTNP